MYTFICISKKIVKGIINLNSLKPLTGAIDYITFTSKHRNSNQEHVYEDIKRIYIIGYIYDTAYIRCFLIRGPFRHTAIIR